MIPNINTVTIFKRNYILPQTAVLINQLPLNTLPDILYKQVKLQSVYLKVVTINNPFQLIFF